MYKPATGLDVDVVLKPRLIELSSGSANDRAGRPVSVCACLPVGPEDRSYRGWRLTQFFSKACYQFGLRKDLSELGCFQFDSWGLSLARNASAAHVRSGRVQAALVRRSPASEK